MIGRSVVFPIVAAVVAVPLAAELREIPQPVLDNLESAVREQLVEERQKVDTELAGYQAGTGDDGRLAEAFGALGRLYYLNDFSRAAEASFLNAIELAPSTFQWRYYLGALYPVLGRLEDAEAQLIAALELRADYVPALIRLGRAQLDLGKLDQAVARFEAALVIDPANAAAHQGLGRVAFEGGDFQGAIEQFERALEIQPEANLIHYQLGLAYRELGDRERALENLKLNRHQDVRLDDPLINNLYRIVRSAKLHFNSGIELLEQNRPELAIEQLEMAIEQRPGQFTYHHNLAAALGLIGRDDEAIEQYRKVLELNPEYPNAHFNLAMLLVKRDQVAEASRHFELAHRYDPEDLVAHTEWATALSLLGEPERAAAELGKVLDQDPTYGKALLNLATVQAKIGRTAAAEATLAELLEGDATAEERAAGHHRRGKIYEQQGDIARAVAAYRAAVGLNDDLGEAHVALAVLLARRQEFAEAAVHFGRGVELEPDDLSSHFGQGLALILAERYVEAREALEASAELHPEDLPIVHLLARLLAAAPDVAARDGGRALEIARRVFSKRQSIDHAETIAMALAETGRYEEAAAWQRDIIAQARRQPAPGSLVTLEQRLAQYERGEPVRAPWR